MSTENLTKSLIELIDETLDELEEVKKSRMSPEEITMGHSANGEMKKEEDADDDDDDKAEKAENPFADKKKDKKDDKDDDKDDDKAEKAEGVNLMVKMSKAEKVAKAEAKMKKALAKYEMRKAAYEMHKGEDKAEKAEGVNKMVKSDSAPTDALEARLNQLTDLVKKIAETPVPARGQTYRDVQPLAKTDETQPLVKSKVIDELFEMKKSGKDVTAEDMYKAETGGSAELATIANKYGIK